MSFEVKLDVFQGPFELLLDLISSQQLDVCDIPIARLTEDYLDHLQRMQELDLQVTTEFLLVAATLLELKARALLPAPASPPQSEDQDTERDLLIARLLEVRTFQAAGDLLARWLAEGDARFPGSPAPDDPALRVLPTLADIAPADLARALVGLLQERALRVDLSLVVSDPVSTEEAAAELRARAAQGPVSFAELARGRGLAWVVALFLAMLELAMRGEVVLGASERVGEIRIALATPAAP